MMNLKFYLRGLGVGIFVTALIMGLVVGGKKETLSDEEIRERARELGMTEESNALVDALAPEGIVQPLEEPEPMDTPEKMPEPTGSPEGTAEPTDSLEPTDSPEPTGSDEPTGTPKKTEAPRSTPREIAEPTAPPKETEAPTAAPTKTPEDEQAKDSEGTSTPLAPGAAPDDGAGSAGTGSGAGSIQVNSGEGSDVVCRKLEEAGVISSATEFDAYLYQNGYDKKIRTGSFDIPAGASYEEIAQILVRR